MLLLRNKYQQ